MDDDERSIITDDRSPTDQVDACRPVDITVDGSPETFHVHGGRPMTNTDRAAFADAARRIAIERDPHAGVRQELIAAGRLVRQCLPDGSIRTHYGDAMGHQVKARMAAAIAAANAALAEGSARGGE